MADVKISELSAVTAVEANDLLEVSEDTGSGYASRKATAAQLKGYVLGSVNVSFTGPTASRTYTLPDANGTILTGNQTITLSGDASGSGATAITVTLANSGVTAGTYKSVTVDGKGRVTAGSNPTTLSGYGISDAAPSSHVGATGAAHGVATTSVAGFMSSTDKAKLDGISSGATANTGTVTSVGLGLPVIFSVSGSPVSTSGTLTATLASQTANTVFAAPDGVEGAPTFRALLAADIPTLNQNTTGTAANVTGTVALANGGTGSTTASGARTNLGLAIGSNVQAYDADLAAIAALTGTSGLLKKTAANTWTLDTAAYITNNQSITLSGDASGSGSTAITVTLANSGVTADTYRSVTVDAKGRVTAGTNPTTLAGYGITDAAPSSHVGATGSAHGTATTSVAGFMSAADKSKLDGIASGATANTGTVTSVGLSLPDVFSVSGSPVTTSGTLTASLASQTANTILAAPNGSAGAPTFRALVAADIPTLNQNTTGTAANVSGTVAVANGGTGATTASAARTNLGLAIGSNVQAYDADLAAIAAISGTSGLLRKTAANTWSLETSSYLTGNQTISLSGDVSGSGSTSISATLANSGVTAGTYTNATVTVDAKGRVTSASSGAASGVTSFSAGTTGLTPSTSTTGAVTLAGTLAVANGGTGATTASTARTNLGLGSAATSSTGDFAAASHVGAGGSAHAAATTSVAGFMSAADKTKLNGIATGATANSGTVTSVSASAGSGISISGSPITSSGTLTITNTDRGSSQSIFKNIANSAGTTQFSAASNSDTIRFAGSGNASVSFNSTSKTVTISASGGTGTVTSVALSGGTTGLSVSGSPITSSGTITLAGTLAVANGGTGATTASSARSNLGAAASGAVTSSGLTMSTARLLGRTSTSTGAVEEISIGSGLTLSSGTLSSSSANPIPSGTVMLFVQTSAPTGWTKSTTHNNKALRVVSGTASSGGSVAFTTAFASQTPSGTVSGTVGNTTLTSTQIPGHTHGSGTTDGFFTSGTPYETESLQVGGGAFNEGIGRKASTASTGGGGSHNHSWSGSFSGSAINLAVQYVDVIIATKS